MRTEPKNNNNLKNEEEKKNILFHILYKLVGVGCFTIFIRFCLINLHLHTPNYYDWGRTREWEKNKNVKWKFTFWNPLQKIRIRILLYLSHIFHPIIFLFFRTYFCVLGSKFWQHIWRFDMQASQKWTLKLNIFDFLSKIFWC